MHLRNTKSQVVQQSKYSLLHRTKAVLFFCCFVLLASLAHAQPPRAVHPYT